MQRKIALMTVMVMILTLLISCGKDKSEARKAEITSKPEMQTENTAETENTQTQAPLFESTDDVTYEKLMNCFTAEYLLKLSDYVLTEEHLDNLRLETKTKITGEYGLGEKNIMAYTAYEDEESDGISENWVGFDGMSMLHISNDEYGYENAQFVYMDMDGYFEDGIRIVDDFDYTDEKKITETIECDDGLFETHIEYSNGGILYAKAIYCYAPVTGALKTYTTDFYYGETEPSMKSVATVTLETEPTYKLIPYGEGDKTNEAKIHYRGRHFTVNVGEETELYFVDSYSADGVFEYFVSDEWGEIYSDYSSAALGKVTEGKEFYVDADWYECYPDYSEEDVETLSVIEEFLTGHWVDDTENPSYSIDIYENMNYVFKRLDGSGNIINTYRGKLDIGELYGDNDYLVFEIDESDDAVLSGLSSIGDYCVVDMYEDDFNAFIGLTQVNNGTAIISEYYDEFNPTWYKTAAAK